MQNTTTKMNFGTPSNNSLRVNRRARQMVKESLTKFATAGVSRRSPELVEDLFITCNSFEERCLGVAGGFVQDYRARYSCIFRYEANSNEAEQFEVDRRKNFSALSHILAAHTEMPVLPIYCNRQNVGDGIGQFRTLFDDFLSSRGCSTITIDITCFTKLYLFELLYFLVEEAKISSLRFAYNQPKAYGNAKLTLGISEIFYIPHFGGTFLPNRETVLIVFLGFETERALGIWEHYEPSKTVVVLADPPMRKDYLDRAKRENAFLITRPGILKVTMNPYDPFAVTEKLEEIYSTHCLDNHRPAYNVGVISLGT
ncbi:MAG: hypothetical protein MN733_40390, partial [Nitrososphaera sp.]|nr:hypothetical protein [Nitrososphaera sp.]